MSARGLLVQKPSSAYRILGPLRASRQGIIKMTSEWDTKRGRSVAANHACMNDGSMQGFSVA